jgi:hypothetical protein
MITFLASASEAPIAVSFGVAGLCAQLAWPLFRSRGAILTVQLGASCCYAASYALMGKETATAVCLIGAIQTTVTLLAGERPWLARMGYVFASGVLTYSGLCTIFAITACCLTMIGRMQVDTLRMRSIQLGAAPFGAAHDVIVGAWPCFAGAIVSFGIAGTALRREFRHRRSDTLTA